MLQKLTNTAYKFSYLNKSSLNFRPGQQYTLQTNVNKFVCVCVCFNEKNNITKGEKEKNL